MNILFIVDKFYPKPYANSICAMKIINKFRENNHFVKIIAFEDKLNKGPEIYNGVPVEYVKPDIRFRLFYKSEGTSSIFLKSFYFYCAKFFSILGKLIFINWLPFFSFSFPRRIRNKVLELDCHDDYDLIVTFVQPFDGAFAVYKGIKKKLIKKKWIIYSLDTLDYEQVEKYYKKSYNTYWLNKFLQYADGLVYMKSREGDFYNTKLKAYSSKLKAADIPLYEIDKNSRHEDNKNYFNNDAENWCYFGSVTPPHYDPRPLVNFFLQLPNDKKRVLHFYCRGGYYSWLKDIENDNEGKVVVNGYVSPEIVSVIEHSADVLVSIKSSNNISAKIFEYFTTEKTVVHFSGCENDPNIYYINQYGNGFVINTLDGNCTKWVSDYNSFIKFNKKPMNNKFLEINEPSYSMEAIMELFFEKTKRV